MSHSAMILPQWVAAGTGSLLCLAAVSLALFLIPRVLLRSNTRRRRTGEDLYQFTKQQQTGNAYIYSYHVYTLSIDESIRAIVAHFEWYRTFHRLSNLRMRVVQDEMVDVTYVRQLPSDGEHLYIIHSSHRILLFFDHVVLGAAFFNTVGAILTGGTKAVLTPVPSFPTRDLAVWKFLWNDVFLPQWVHAPPPPSPPFVRYTDATQMHRLQLHEPIDRIKSRYPATSSLVSIAYFSLHAVLSRIPSRKSLRCYLTYGFADETHCQNNVGVVFVDFTLGMSVVAFEQQIQRKRYQAVATNVLMQLFDRGKATRQSVDCVLSMGYCRTVENHPTELLVTFGTIPDYPIYVCTCSMETAAFVSITSSTPELLV